MRPSYGDVRGEYAALREAVAVVEGGHDLVWVEGPEAVSFLQGIVSQDVEALAQGRVARSFLLGPQGKLRALLWLLRGEERVGIVTDPGHGGRVADDLDRYRIRVKAEIRADPRPMWELWGPGSAAGGPPSGRWVDRDGLLRAALPSPALPRVVMTGGSPPEGVTRAGELALTAARVEAGEPVFGRDVDERTIPQETGLVSEAVSFTKGCYLGQELVARIDTRGRVNRHLRGLSITRNLLPPEGAAVYAGDREVGAITSVAEGPLSPIGLALLRREVEPGDEVEVRWDGEGVPAIVRALPFGGQG